MSLRRGRATWASALFGVWLLVASGSAVAQNEPAKPDAAPVAAVSGNPAATTFSIGTGWLGRTLGLRDEWGIKIGGLWLADTNLVVAGGAQPGGWTNNSALFLGLDIDDEKIVGCLGS